jgi:hypothetical protein
MATASTAFNVNNVSTWTYNDLKHSIQSGRNGKRKAFYTSFFAWTQDEYKEASQEVVAELSRHPFDLSMSFPTTGSKARYRDVAQRNLLQNRPDLFLDRHGPQPPVWFTLDLIGQDAPAGVPYNSKCVLQQLIGYMNSHASRKTKRNRQVHIIEDDSDEDDRVGVKKQRGIAPTNATSAPSVTSSAVNIFDAMTNVTSGPASTPQNIEERLPHAQVTPANTSPDTIRNSQPLFLYIAKLTIVNQVLHLTRNRFCIPSHLFNPSNNHLIEPRLQELIFGNPLDNKPTHLYFFDPTTNGTLRSVRNRPAAEAAIALLTWHAEATNATGIQLFDAPDLDTIGLVPAHEALRTTDFEENVSFELEIDYGDGNGEEAADVASRVDSGHGSRDTGSVQVKGDGFADAIDVKPDIIWDGGQKSLNQSESESDSESEEE